MTSEQQNQTFERMLDRDGSYRLAERIRRLKSYRAYAQRYPYDGSERPYSLDWTSDVDDNVHLVDMLPSSQMPLDAAQMDAERVDEFRAMLSPRQKQVIGLLEQGYKTSEVANMLGYKHTGGVRFIKWAVRRKYERFIVLNG